MRLIRLHGLLALALLALCASAVGADDTKSDDKDKEKEKTPAQAEKSFSKEVTITVKMNYLLYLPENFDADSRRWPLMLFLHGAGESGTDLTKVKQHGPPKIVETKKDFPFILVSPQSSGRGWNADTLNALLDDVMQNYRVDPDRVYLTGLSMGGFGTWALAAAHPERFAAIAPICGGGNPRDAAKIKDLPIWVFHGAKDPTVPLRSSQAMVDALKEAKAPEVKFTIYPDAGHDSWTETYNNPDLYKWFLEHKKSH
jgi:predicted peptidase